MLRPSGCATWSTTATASPRRWRDIARSSARRSCPPSATVRSAVTTREVEQWIASVDRSANTRRIALVLLHGIFARAKKVWDLPSNPVADVEKPPTARSGGSDGRETAAPAHYDSGTVSALVAPAQLREPVHDDRRLPR
jgi:hypothetical protein